MISWSFDATLPDEWGMSPQEVSAPSTRIARASRISSRWIIAEAVAVTTLWTIYVAVGAVSPHLQWIANIVFPFSVVGLVIVVVSQRPQNVRKPLVELESLLPKIRDSEAPIEAIDSIIASLDAAEDVDLKSVRAVAEHVREALRDNKRQKLKLSKLHEEMRQRIATRTDALERTIGLLRTASTRDPLTALGNRRMLEAAMPKLIEACRAEKAPMSVLAIDVDHFKQLNDTLGHPAGDAYLRDLAQLLRSTIRPNDMAFRLGGDEFVIILPTCDASGASKLALRLQTLVDALSDTIRIPTPPGISIGIAELNDRQTTDGADLLGIADRSLYSAKQSRRLLARSA